MVKVISKIPELAHFLHVEDMQEVHDVLIGHLRSMGFQNKVTHALTIKDAISLIKEESFDGIILDWNLPDGTGFEFLKKLKASKKFGDIPVLMCTTVDQAENILDAIKEGAKDYLVKPWTKKELFEKLNSLF